MYKGGSRLAVDGFTIVETLIVLAVTGALLFSVAVLMNGKQNKSQFTRGINDLQQQLQQIINETASGQYPDTGNFKCQNGYPSYPSISSGSQAQGTNAGCLFLGKAIQFGTNDPSQIGIYTLVGNQYTTTSKPVEKLLTEAKPRAIYPANATEGGIPTNIYTTVQMEYGLRVADQGTCSAQHSMCFRDASSSYDTGTLAFVAADQAGYLATGHTLNGASTNQVEPGSVQLSLYAVKNSLVNNGDPMDVSSQIRTSLVSATKGATICIVGSGGKLSGLFTIDSGLNVSVKIYGDATC